MTVARSNSTRACVFCGKTRTLSNEHIFPRWATTEWYGEVTGSPIDHRQEAPFREVQTERRKRGFAKRVTRRVHTGRPILHATSMKVKKVCKKCNNEWMSSLEKAVQPTLRALFRGSAITLSEADSALLMRWCQKTSLVFEVYSPHKRTVPPGVFDAVYRGAPVEGTWAYRVAKVGRDAAFSWNHTPLDTNLRERADGPTVAVEHIGVQTMFAVGNITFITRFSPHGFRHPCSLDEELDRRLGPDAGRLEPGSIIRPSALPSIDWYLWDELELWAVNRGWRHPRVVEDSSGATWVQQPDDAPFWQRLRRRKRR